MPLCKIDAPGTGDRRRPYRPVITAVATGQEIATTPKYRNVIEPTFAGKHSNSIRSHPDMA